MIGIEQFRAIANNQQIGGEQAVYVANRAKTQLCCNAEGVPRKFTKPGGDVKLAQDSIYMRSQLLSIVCTKFGETNEVFKAAEKKLFGELVGGKEFDPDFASKPLSKREIMAVLEMVDVAPAEEKGAPDRAALDTTLSKAVAEMTDGQTLAPKGASHDEANLGVRLVAVPAGKRDAAFAVLRKIVDGALAKGRALGKDDLAHLCTKFVDKMEKKGLIGGNPDVDSGIEDMSDKQVVHLRKKILRTIFKTNVAPVLKQLSAPAEPPPAHVSEPVQPKPNLLLDEEPLIPVEPDKGVASSDGVESSAPVAPKAPWQPGPETLKMREKYNAILTDPKLTTPKMRTEKISKLFTECLSNKAFVAEQAGRTDFNVRTGAEILKTKPKLVDEIRNDTRGDAVKKMPFSRVLGGSTTAVAQAAGKARAAGKPFKAFMGIFADNTFCGCGVEEGWNTQEEANFREVGGLEFMAYLMAKQLIKRPESEKHEKSSYIEDPNGQKLSPASDGYLVNTQVQAANMQKLDEPIDVVMQMRALSSLNQASWGHDVEGNVTWLMDSLELQYVAKESAQHPEKDVESLKREFRAAYEPQRDQARLALKELYAQLGLKGGVCTEKGQGAKDALMLFMYTQAANVFASPKKGVFSASPMVKEMRKLVSLVTSTKSSDKAKLADLLKTANRNFEDILRLKVRQDIVTARDAGATHFVGGAIGVGAFANDVKLIARIYAEEFCKHGGDMEYIFPEIGSDGPANAEAFEAAFKAAYAANA